MVFILLQEHSVLLYKDVLRIIFDSYEFRTDRLVIWNIYLQDICRDFCCNMLTPSRKVSASYLYNLRGLTLTYSGIASEITFCGNLGEPLRTLPTPLWKPLVNRNRTFVRPNPNHCDVPVMKLPGILGDIPRAAWECWHQITELCKGLQVY